MALRTRPTVVLNVVLIVLALTALAFIALRSEPSPGIEVVRRDPEGYVDTIVVEVRGSVVEPGVYSVSPGARVEQAVARAGGLTEDADTQALNFALRVQDEDVIYVPSFAEAAQPLIDLNVATTEELQVLPGIGPARGLDRARASVALRRGSTPRNVGPSADRSHRCPAVARTGIQDRNA